MVNLVGWLAKSKIAKKVAETEFAKKAYERAYEKFRKMPIILRVDIQNVKGNLAINLPPPPSNRLWYVPFSFLLFYRAINVLIFTRKYPVYFKGRNFYGQKFS